MESVPVKAPTEVGANCSWYVALCPTGKEEATLPPTTVNPAPAMAAWEMFTVAVPVFVIVTFCVPVALVTTLPKLTLDELADSTPEPAGPPTEFELVDAAAPV
jgi:hypothetical protein